MFYKLFLIFNFFILTQAKMLCNHYSKQKFGALATQYPQYAEKLNAVGKTSIAIWYTDRSDSLDQIKDSVNNCNGYINNIVIYGIPGKDCKDKYSSDGSNKNMEDYINFLNKLVDVVGTNSVIYTIEPDAIGLTANNGCGIENNYIEYLKTAVSILSKNINAYLYIDVSYWFLIYDIVQVQMVVDIFKEVIQNTRVRGITLNTSNYRSNDEMVKACSNFRQLAGPSIFCIIDTSRNFNSNSDDNEWCNLKTAGIGLPSTCKTKNDIIDYYISIKVIGELDGSCDNHGPNSYKINKNAGDFDIEYFNMIYDQGFHLK